MAVVIYNLIVSSANSSDYWPGIRREAAKHDISGHVLLCGAHRIGVADLSKSTLDDMAWNLYSKLPNVVQGLETGLVSPDTDRWAFVTKSEFERVRRRLQAIEIKRGPEKYEIKIGRVYDGSESIEPSQTAKPAAQVAVGGNNPGEPYVGISDEVFLILYRGINSPRRAKAFLDNAFRKH